MKTVIITGATRGIGAAAALKFASADYAICAVYRQDDSSARVLIDKLASNGCFASAIKADVSDPQQCRRVRAVVDFPPRRHGGRRDFVFD